MKTPGIIPGSPNYNEPIQTGKSQAPAKSGPSKIAKDTFNTSPTTSPSSLTQKKIGAVAPYEKELKTNISNLKSEIKELKASVKNDEKNIETIRGRIPQTDLSNEEIISDSNQAIELQKNINQKKDQIKQKEFQLSDLSQRLDGRIQYIAEKQENLKVLEREMTEAYQNLGKSEGELTFLKTQLENQKKEIDNLKVRIANAKKTHSPNISQLEEKQKKLESAYKIIVEERLDKTEKLLPDIEHFTNIFGEKHREYLNAAKEFEREFNVPPSIKILDKFTFIFKALPPK